MKRWALGLLVLTWACGPDDPVTPAEDDSTGDSAATTTNATTNGDPTTGLPPTAGNPTGADGGSTGDGLDTGYEDDDGGTGCTFTCPDPPPPVPPPTTGGGGFQECSLTIQDCPEGEKCMPWANDGGTEWNATRCAPVYGEPPGLPGERCTVEGSGYSGIDSCDVGVMCWQVDPKTNEGVCTAMCGDTPTVGPCVTEGESCVEVDIIPLCVAPCDPVTAVCPEGQGCFPADGGFRCRLAAAEPATLGEPCDGRTACEPGLLCAHGASHECGGEPGEGCCATPCDVNDPAACVPGSCEPWFVGGAPEGFEHLGVCAGP